MRTTKAILTLECKLTEPQLKECSKKLAEAISQHSRVENEIETFKAQKKVEIQRLDGVMKCPRRLIARKSGVPWSAKSSLISAQA